MLETCLKRSLWEPPIIDIKELIVQATQHVNATQGDSFLYIFRITPYIDALYIEYDSEYNPRINKRFTFCEGLTWTYQDELFFHGKCVSSSFCAVDGDVCDSIYEYYNKLHPEWHLKGYILDRIRLLDHIYNCMRKNTAKELLYKSGLDELAVNIYELDELNMLSTTPSDIFDGVPIKVLRSINCKCGIKLLSNDNVRKSVKEINRMYPNIFKESLNAAQCLYIHYLIENELTPIEVGRLFEAHKGGYERIWNLSRIQDEFLEEKRRKGIEAVKEKIREDIFKEEIRKLELEEVEALKALKELEETIGSIDPIYLKYIKKTRNPLTDFRVNQLQKYLGVMRLEYDKKIRRNNRKKNQEWQERDHGYVVRFPQTINDFCREAIYMQNCLGGYIPAVLEDDTTIMFIRKPNDVNKPFITMEVHEGQLTQAYHRFNNKCSGEEKRWIKEYCRRHDIEYTFKK